MMIKIGICGIGFVGKAIMTSLITHNFIHDENLFIYDKFNENYCDPIKLLQADIIFFTLPTKFDTSKKSYNVDAILENIEFLSFNKYKGLIIIKSTLEPGTTDMLSEINDLNFIYNPEFLTARTAYEDFHNQKHVVIGTPKFIVSDKYIAMVTEFYKTYYPNADISICEAIKAESMKIFLNCFYATKVQFFTEIYLLCQKMNMDYNNVKDLMLKNGWINQMHTNIPGPDGQVSYGGMCFPKDTNALNYYMESLNTPHSVLQAVIKERNKLRNDHDNILFKKPRL